MLERMLQYRLRLILIFFLVLFVSGCETAYYGTMEKLGYHKRNLMVNRVESARDSQENAKEQFESALEKFSSVLQFDGGDLEDKYDQVLFLKHNLNARAIASLQTELISVESEVNSLIKDMNASIKEADAFISTMTQE